MATRGHLGGLAVAVPDAVRVLSAVGMPVVLVETVGVGQQEVEVAAATDTTVVVVNPGLGGRHPGQQGRAAGDRRPVRDQQGRPARARGETRRDLELMLDLTELGEWRPPIVDTVASTGDGVDALWAAIGRPPGPPDGHRGTLAGLRRERLEPRVPTRSCWPGWRERIDDLLAAGRFADIAAAMAGGDLDPYEAADRLLAGLVPGSTPPVPVGERTRAGGP